MGTALHPHSFYAHIPPNRRSRPSTTELISYLDRLCLPACLSVQ
jgi:hypothetical protein